jgi:hypothetical protein
LLVVVVVVTLLVKAAAIKLPMKRMSAMTANSNNTNCDLLLAVFIIAQ